MGFRCELLLLHEPEHDRLRRHGAGLLPELQRPRGAQRDDLVLLVLHNVRHGAHRHVLQHTARRDRPPALPPAGQARAREGLVERGRAVGRPVRHDLVTISEQQPLPPQRHRGEPLHERAARQPLRPRERDQHTQGFLQSGGRDARLQAHPQAGGPPEAGGAGAGAGAPAARRLHAAGARRGARRGEHRDVNAARHVCSPPQAPPPAPPRPPCRHLRVPFFSPRR